jgi:hypothetical protein
VTVGELRAELAEYPDDKRVIFCTREDCNDDAQIFPYEDDWKWGERYHDTLLVRV